MTLSDRLRALCAQLDPHANCSSRIDYQCTVCKAADELELLYERRRTPPSTLCEACLERWQAQWAAGQNDEIIND